VGGRQGPGVSCLRKHVGKQPPLVQAHVEEGGAHTHNACTDGCTHWQHAPGPAQLPLCICTKARPPAWPLKMGLLGISSSEDRESSSSSSSACIRAACRPKGWGEGGGGKVRARVAASGQSPIPLACFNTGPTGPTANPAAPTMSAHALGARQCDHAHHTHPWAHTPRAGLLAIANANMRIHRKPPWAATPWCGPHLGMRCCLLLLQLLHSGHSALPLVLHVAVRAGLHLQLHQGRVQPCSMQEERRRTVGGRVACARGGFLALGPSQGLRRLSGSMTWPAQEQHGTGTGWCVHAGNHEPQP